MNEEQRAAGLPWWLDDPRRLASELAAMHAIAPGLLWHYEGSGFWSGHAPLWPFERPQPRGWASLVCSKPFAVEIICSEAYPMVEPIVRPLEIEPPPDTLGLTDWHLLPSGALCLLQEKSSWDPSALAAVLIEKISSWYIEYHLMREGYIQRMTERGIANDTSLDHLLRQIGTRADAESHYCHRC